MTPRLPRCAKAVALRSGSKVLQGYYRFFNLFLEGVLLVISLANTAYSRCFTDIALDRPQLTGSNASMKLAKAMAYGRLLGAAGLGCDFGVNRAPFN